MTPTNTPKVTPAILAARKKATQVLKRLKRKNYFHEDNAEFAIRNMLNSGLGRTGLRSLAKKMMVSWKDFQEMVDAVVEMEPQSLTPGAIRAIKESDIQAYLNEKMSLRQYAIRDYIFKYGHEREEAEKLIDEMMYLTPATDEEVQTIPA